MDNSGQEALLEPLDVDRLLNLAPLLSLRLRAWEGERDTARSPWPSGASAVAAAASAALEGDGIIPGQQQEGTRGAAALSLSERVFAGAPRVIVSLWKVDDAATKALMVKFYELWNPKDGSKGLPTATALRKAQAFVRSHVKWEHPYYWAAWQLWGLGS